jgi:hypothetical protein
MKKFYLIMTFSLLIIFAGNLYSEDSKIDQFVNSFLVNIINGNVNESYELLDPRKQNPEAKKGLADLSYMLNKQKIDSNRVLFVKNGIMYFNGEKTYYHTISYEYTINKNYYLLETIVEESNNKYHMNKFILTPIPFKAEYLNQFSLYNKSIIHYIYFFFMITIPLFILVTLVFMLRTKMNKKWLWFLAIIITLVKISMNWETGQMDFQIFAIQILGTGFTKFPIYNPWQMYISLPIGAIIFWINKFKSVKTEQPISNANGV